jgi:hypothetical protein
MIFIPMFGNMLIIVILMRLLLIFDKFSLSFEKVSGMLLFWRHTTVPEVVTSVRRIALHILKNELLLKTGGLKVLGGIICLFNPLMAAVIAGIRVSPALVVCSSLILIVSWGLLETVYFYEPVLL